MLSSAPGVAETMPVRAREGLSLQCGFIKLGLHFYSASALFQTLPVTPSTAGIIQLMPLPED